MRSEQSGNEFRKAWPALEGIDRLRKGILQRRHILFPDRISVVVYALTYTDAQRPLTPAHCFKVTFNFESRESQLFQR